MDVLSLSIIFVDRLDAIYFLYHRYVICWFSWCFGIQTKKDSSINILDSVSQQPDSTFLNDESLLIPVLENDQLLLELDDDDDDDEDFDDADGVEDISNEFEKVDITIQQDNSTSTCNNIYLKWIHVLMHVNYL